MKNNCIIRVMVKYTAIITLLIYSAVAAATPVHAAQDPSRLNNDGVLQAEKGNYAQAVKFLRKAAMLEPNSILIKENLTTALNNYGVVLMNDTQTEKAIKVLVEAISIMDSTDIRGNLSNAFVMRGRVNEEKGLTLEGRQDFYRALMADSQNVSALRALGVSLYDDGQIKEASRYIERAIELDPDNQEDIKKLLKKLKNEENEEAKYFKQVTSHFKVSYSPDISYSKVSYIIRVLNKAFIEHRMFFGSAPKGKIPVVVYPDEGKFASINHLTGNIRGIYDGKVRIPVYSRTSAGDMKHTLYHELAHAFIHHHGGNDIPLWLNEGIAERVSNKMRVTHSFNYARKSGKPLIHISKLDGALRNTKNGEQAALAYDQALQLTKYMEKKYGTFGMRRIVKTFKTEKSRKKAFKKSIFMTEETFFRNWFNQLR